MAANAPNIDARRHVGDDPDDIVGLPFNIRHHAYLETR
jgi:hypothetical protein